MKRRAKPWQEKVDEFCRTYLEVYGEANRLMAKAPVSSDLRSFVQSPNPFAEVFKQHPELRETKTILLKPEFVQMLEEVPRLKGSAQAGEHVYPVRMAEMLETAQNLALFPSLSPELKMTGYLWLAFWFVVLRDFLRTMRRRQYGKEALDQSKMATLAAQFFEMLAHLCRGQIPRHKGKYNLELVGLVKIIQEHQTEEMNPRDLRGALAAAGVSVSEGETWRVWLWRAKKKGLIPGGPQGAKAGQKKS